MIEENNTVKKKFLERPPVLYKLGAAGTGVAMEFGESVEVVKGVQLMVSGVNEAALIEVLDDFYGDRATIKVLEIACSFTNDYVCGHAIRSGIANENSSPEAVARLVPTVRQDLAFESDQIRDRNFPNFYSISDKHSPEDNMMQISAFLDVGEEKARQVAETPYLFAD